MMRNLIHEKLAQSPRFAPGNDRAAGKNGHGQQVTDESLTTILDKEENHARRSAQEKSVTRINEHREQIVKNLTELISNYEDRQEELQKELSEITELKKKIDELPEQISTDDVKHCKQLLQAADYKFIQYERDIADSNTQSNSKEGLPQSIIDASFFQLTRAGLALTWPLILAVTAAFTTLGLIMYSLFAIQ